MFSKIFFHLKKMPFYIISHPKMIIDYLYLKYKGVDTEYGFVKLMGKPIIHKTKGSKIILGKGCTLVSKSKYNFAGINHPVILATLTPNAVIRIGTVGISGSSICAVKLIEIGDFSGLGVNTNIYDTDFHAMGALERRNQVNIEQANSSEIIIGKDVWIAANSTILKGVKIGDEAIIGAGSIVVSSVPSKTIFAGNPAKKIRDL